MFSLISRGNVFPALLKLEKYYATNLNGRGISIRNGKASLEFPSLYMSNKRVLGLLSRAVAEGSVRSVNVGSVVGPKILLVLEQLRLRSLNHPHELYVTGIMSPTSVFAKAVSRHDPTGGISAYTMTTKELAEFERIFKEIDLRRCGHSLLAPVEPCTFRIRIRAGEISATYTLF